MTSTVGKPYAQAILDLMPTIPASQRFLWAPGRVVKTPAMVVELPDIRDGEEDQLNAVSLVYSFPVTFYVDLAGKPQAAQAKLIDLLETFMQAVRDNAGLIAHTVAEATALDVDSSNAEVAYIDESPRWLMAYRTTVDVSVLLPD